MEFIYRNPNISKSLFNMLIYAQAKPQPTSMMSSLHLTQDGSTTFEDHILYRTIIGTLQFNMLPLQD